MADTNNLNLPPIVEGKQSGSVADNSTPLGTEQPIDPMPAEAGTKTYLVGGAIVLVLAIVLVFLKQGYANHLIGTKRRSPNQGNAAAWALFGTLFFPAIAAGLGYVKGADSLMTLPFMLPIGLGMVVCLVLTVMLSSKK
jgi:hypothetical protein